MEKERREQCSILRKAVTSPETLFNDYSVKSMLYKTPPPYFILLAIPVKTLEVKAIEFHIIGKRGQYAAWHKAGRGFTM